MSRRFPPPWSVEELEECLVVRDGDGHESATLSKDHRRMLAFTDSQLRTVWTAAYNVPAEKRRLFIERVVARLQLHSGFTDADLDDAVRATLTGLVQSAA
jgi:hypothetical protein